MVNIFNISKQSYILEYNNCLLSIVVIDSGWFDNNRFKPWVAFYKTNAITGTKQLDKINRFLFCLNARKID